jgi:ribosomal protein S18 acetylase RimI-like enzyme
MPEVPHWPEQEYRDRAGNQPDPTGIPLRRCLFAAISGETISGYAAARVLHIGPDSEAELESVAVAPSHRRQGIGLALCEAAIRWATTQGATTFILEVRSRSAGARRLYATLGLAESGLRKGYYHAPDDDAVLMCRAL